MTIAGTTELICFLVLSAVVVIGALGVVLLSNIVYSAFLLGGVCGCSRGACAGVLTERIQRP